MYKYLNKWLKKKILILNNISHRLCLRYPCVSAYTKEKQVGSSTLSGWNSINTFPIHDALAFFLLHCAKLIKGMMHRDLFFFF